MSSEKLRIVVLSIFLIALIVFGVAYKPTAAMSQPTSGTQATPTQQARPHR